MPSGKMFDNYKYANNAAMVLSLALLSLTAQCLPQQSRSTNEGNSGAFAYVANSFQKDYISAFRADGPLTPLSPATYLAGRDPYALTVDPAGHFLYVVNSASDDVSQFAIRSNGSLVPLSPPTVSNSGDNDIIVSPDGRTVYVCGERAIYQYRLSSDGTLHPLSPPTVSTSLPGAINLAITPSGRFAYALLLNRGEPLGYAAGIDEFRVLPDGTLKPILNDSIGVGVTMPKQIVAGPDSRFVYVASEWINGGDYTGTGLLLLQVGKGGGLTPIGKAGKGLNSIGEFYLSTVSRLLFLPSGRNAVAVSEEGDTGSEILSTLRVAPDGHLVQTGMFVIQEDGRLTGINMPHPPRCADISDMVVDPSTHMLYLVDNFAERDAAVLAYRYDESGSDLRLSGPAVSKIGGFPYRMVIARPQPAAASRRPSPKRAGSRLRGRSP